MAVTREEGGSNAIKGFLFQFDRTILEIVDNPRKVIRVEQSEDIEREKYYIQVKNRESARYYPSHIRRATSQLFNLFLEDEEREFCLCCHFKDKTPCQWRPSVDEIRTILGKTHGKQTEEKVESFSSHFVVQFCDDYESGFDIVIKSLRRSFALGTREVAVMYHAVIRSYLLDLAVKDVKKRETSFEQLRSVVREVRSRVTMDGYQDLLGAEKYERSVRKMYLVHRRLNIDPFERLLVIECDETVTPTDVMQMIMSVSKTYFIKGKSPQPYILFRKLNDDVTKEIKRGLIDKGFFFNDGTWFDGDKVRADKLFAKNNDEAYGKVKLLPTKELLESNKILGHFDEIYEFYVRDSLAVKGFTGRYIEIPVINSQQTLKILRK
ncbi:MAG: hypothetical protein ACYTFW_21240 [Planctomycetota bacterium]